MITILEARLLNKYCKLQLIIAHHFQKIGKKYTQLQQLNIIRYYVLLYKF